jgi:hypothetical protein
VPDELAGSAAQLGINLAGMIVAGSAVLAVQRVLTRPGVRDARQRLLRRQPA